MFCLEKWRKTNLYYYEDLENLYKFFVLPNVKVLEIGVGVGHLLSAVKPEENLGIDSNPEAIALGEKLFPELKFYLEKAEKFQPDSMYDYVILANTISYLSDIQKCFSNIKKGCKPSSRVILTYHNPAWEPILKLATFIKQRTPVDTLNWLSYQDIKNILDLEGFEDIYYGKRMLLPRNIPLVSWLFNQILAPLPIINRFCLTEYIVARLKSDSTQKAEYINNISCSVIIPARNEAGNIEGCITRMPQLGKHTEIIFIEGHSQDNTWQEIERIKVKYGDRYDIKIAQQKGKGKGDAVRQGFNIATGDILIILDSDLTVRPEDLNHFFEAVASGSCEMANGCRLIYPVSPKAMPWINQIANRFFAWSLSYLLNTKIKDSLCGTKVISRENYLKIAENRHYFGEFDPFGDFDLLFGAAKLGLKIKDIPVRYEPRTYGSSNIQHLKEGLVLLKMCLYAARKIKFKL